MASSLFSQQRSSSPFSRLNQLKGMLDGDPQTMYRQLMPSNPQFAEFVRAN